MAVGVALGAFGAHALRDTFDAAQLELWKTAQEYQIWHALGLVLVGILEAQRKKPLALVGWLLIAGTLLFSGSLYALAFTGQNWLGAVTPLGGACFIAAWLAFAVACGRKSG